MRPPAAAVGELPPLTEAEAGRLVAGAAASAGSVRRYQAVLGVRGEAPEGRFSGRMLVVFERPEDGSDPAAVAALRMEAFAPVGGSRWTLVARPGRVDAVVPPERVFAVGQRLAEFTDRVLGVAVSLEEVAALLVGTGVPLRAEPTARPAEEGGAVRLGRGEILWWDLAADGRPLRRVAASGYGAAYPDDWKREGRQVPRRMEVYSSDVRAELTVEELRVNAELHPEAFDLRVPERFQRVSVRDLTRAMRRSPPPRGR